VFAIATKQTKLLFLIDNVYRIVEAGGEVSGLLGRLSLARWLPAHAGERDR
jgi:F0F1-type ATP synthase beta subunit